MVFNSFKTNLAKAYSNVLGKTIEEANEVIDRTEKIILYQLKNLLKE